MFLNPNIFSNLNSNCSDLLDLRNLQEQVIKAFCYQKLFWPLTVWTNCSSDLKIFANSRPSASNLQTFSWSLERFFLTVGQNNFGNKITFVTFFPVFFDSATNCSTQKKRKRHKIRANYINRNIFRAQLLFPMARYIYENYGDTGCRVF